MAIRKRQIKKNSWQRIFQEWAADGGENSTSSRLVVYDDGLLPVGLARLCANVHDDSLLVVATDDNSAEHLADQLEAYLTILDDSRHVVRIPEVAVGRNQWMPENEAVRCAALDAALNHQPGIYVACARTLLSKCLEPAKFKRESLQLKVGDAISMEDLCQKLVELDYDNEAEVGRPGEFARRGGIVDVFSPLYDSPVRIEFFGDEIDGMRKFSAETQRSIEKVSDIRIIPRGIAVLEPREEDLTPLMEFFRPKVRMIVCNPLAIDRQLEKYASADERTQWNSYFSAASDKFEIWFQFSGNQESEHIESDGTPLPADDVVSTLLDVSALADLFANDDLDSGNGIAVWHWQMLRDDLLRWDKSGYRVVACCSGDGEIARLKEMLAEDESTANLMVEFCRLELDCGIMIPQAHLVLLSDNELFGRRNVRHIVRHVDYKYESSLRDAIDLEEGVMAVHVDYGICIYHGIKIKHSGDDVMEVIELEFANNARMYVQLEDAHLVSRYMGGSKIMPELSVLGGSGWQHSKEKAAGAAWGLAAELLRIEAVRQSAMGIEFKPCVDWERSFAGSFPYTTTRDQQNAIDACLQDMEAAKPMDRLLCGDVGYGKTEVAIRAAFRAVMNGHQVAMLVPTTVLAQQHFQTFSERMSEYPVRIEMLSRFRTAGEQRATLERLQAGEIDIIIGTHRIIQSDVKFASLGLLIIDEEQRFGVKHKQKLKELRASLDILTMTATPIPRTLYMSLSGIRNLSTIMTAPSNRLPVQTIVAYYDKELIRQAIMRELERKGQVYFLFNRVQGIEQMAQMLKDLVPEARIVIGHGQMSPGQLEKIMTNFVSYKYDVLVSTTIIESGLDIPNANTIIIDRADRFGLSELYQLRGRVGRDFRQGYAYLLLPPMGALPENARRRLAALKRYTHLGAGFKLAMKDLEIRGAGNILGEEQSGHIAAVGFELYCSLLQEAVARLEKRELPVHNTLSVEFDLVTTAVKTSGKREQALIPAEYVADIPTRLDCYKRLDNLKNLDDLNDFSKELADRFGTLPVAVENLLAISKIKLLAARKKLISLKADKGHLFMESSHGLVRINGKVPVLMARTGHAQLAEILKILKE